MINYMYQSKDFSQQLAALTLNDPNDQSFMLI